MKSSLLCASAGLLAVASFSSLALAQERLNGADVVSGEVIVKFRDADPSLPARIQGDADSDRPEKLSRSAPVYLLKSRRKSVRELLGLLRNRAEVEYIEPNYIFHTTRTPSDASYTSLWGLSNTGQAIAGVYGKPGADISAAKAWDVTTGSAASVVGVIDTGIDYRHADLAANVWSAPSSFTVAFDGITITCAAGTHGFNAITNTCDPLDDAQHGTHVSGTIGASGNNGAGVAGVNWTARIMGLKFLDASGSGSTSNAIKAIDFAIQAKQALGAAANLRVFSASWGGDGYSQALYDAINRANTANILFVAAAGNSARNNDTVAQYPANYSLPNLISVAATTNTDTLASFSNYGASKVHLGAPGVYIYSTVPGGGYGWMSGTSMATPHVSGAAALVLAACPLNTAQLRSVLLNSVDPVAALAGKTSTGGRLNVWRAVSSCGAQPSGQEVSIWNSAASPTEHWRYDSPLTLGVKFRSDAAGQITGIRFWKDSPNDNGQHIGILYTKTGTVLAQATFTSETSGGWQQVKFAAPVTIAPNTTYVAAYFSTSGWSSSGSYFVGKGADAPPLHALQSGVDGTNGLYVYGVAPKLPFASRGANYWVDVLFAKQ